MYVHILIMYIAISRSVYIHDMHVKLFGAVAKTFIALCTYNNNNSVLVHNKDTNITYCPRADVLVVRNIYQQPVEQTPFKAAAKTRVLNFGHLDSNLASAAVVKNV